MRKAIIVILILALALTGVASAAGNAFGKNKVGQNMGEPQDSEYLCEGDLHGKVDDAGYDVYKFADESCPSGFAWYTCNGYVFYECTDEDLIVV